VDEKIRFMSPQLTLIKLRLRLNKLHSNDYDNVPDWTAVEAIRKATLSWVRRQLHAMNRMQEGDEESRMRIDDLQILLSEKVLNTRNLGMYADTEKLPTNYLFFKRLDVYASEDECKSQLLDSNLVEEANVGKYLNDWAWKPSFEFRETFHTILSNKLRVYTGDQFSIDKVKLLYYRTPIAFDVSGITHEDGKQGLNQGIEFKDDVADMIIDEAITILAADLEATNQLQMTKQRLEDNN
jgi:hypothetical protein